MKKIKLTLLIASSLFLFSLLSAPDVKAIEAGDLWYEYWKNYQSYGENLENVSSTITVLGEEPGFYIQVSLWSPFMSINQSSELMIM